MVSGIYKNFDVEEPEETKSDTKIAARDADSVLPQSEMLVTFGARFRLVVSRICTTVVAPDQTSYLTLTTNGHT